jgi:pimeloyl-ACP methyl ester carboxylesterase
MDRIKTEEFKIKVDGGNVYAKKWTPEKVLFKLPAVLLHDSLGSVDLWRDFPKLLAKRLSRTVIAYDRLGFGKSDKRNKIPSLNFIEEEALKYFPDIKSGLMISKYILIGHSVGGGMAVNIASMDKDCKCVVTIASQAFVEKRTLEGIKKAKNQFEKSGQLERLEKWHGNKAKWVLDFWTTIWLSQKFSDWSLHGCIENVKCPVLAVHGEDDEYGSSAFPEFIAGKAGGISEMIIMKNCGHLPHREKPDEVINFLEKFFLENKL